MVVLVIAVVGALALFGGGAVTMLGFHVLADHTPIPAYGYWASFWINIGFGLVLWPHLVTGSCK